MKHLLTTLLLTLALQGAHAVQVKEALQLAPVAVATSDGIQLSWRWLTRFPAATSFDIYRNGTKLTNTTRTSLVDTDGKPGDTYKVLIAGTQEAAEATAWDNIFTTISVRRPAPIKSGNTTGRYRPDDMSVGDLDGDGQYELVLKWLPDNARDSGKDGYASPAIIAAYEMDGTPLWQQPINIGPYVRSGNHTTQFLVYDFDGDGRAEILFKTAPGTTDGQGAYVSAAGNAAIQAVDNTKETDKETGKEIVNSKGRVTTAEEFLTIFEGATGRAMQTIWYSPSRSMTLYPTGDAADWKYNSGWADTSYNRGERYNAAVAYLDGTTSLPTAIMQRGYYSYMFVWAVDWDGTNLTTRWLHRGSQGKWEVFDAAGNVTRTSTAGTSYGQGVHGISVADVNGDGHDEICFGASTIASDGSLLCATGFGHGDAIHLTDLCPDRPGLEVMMPHEEKPYGYDVHDATTGELIYSATGTADNGRGLAADFIPANRGFEFWSSADKNIRSCTDGTLIKSGCPDTNFRIYWTGDPYDQTFDGRYNSTADACAPRIIAYNTSGGANTVVQDFSDFGSPMACNTTKATPCLQADILGDWREELIMFQHESDWSAPDCKLLIYSTPEPTDYTVPCLMEDHTYRMGIAWQNSSYNQPPHLGYYLPDYLHVDGTTYTTHVSNHAPAPAPAPEATTGEATLKPAAADKAVAETVCVTTAADMMTASEKDGYVKMRCNTLGNTWQFTVKPGYKITKIVIDARSNNTKTTATIDATSLTADGAEQLTQPFTFPTTNATLTCDNLAATGNITVAFDTSNIGDLPDDHTGKNAQLYARVTFTYEKVTGIDAMAATPRTHIVKAARGGQITIGNYNTAGQQIK